MTKCVLIAVWSSALFCLQASHSWAADPAAAKLELKRDDARGQLQVLIDDREALAYQYAADVDVPHYYPMRSPSGQLLTVQRTEPYPHHRSIWFADTVRLGDHPPMSFYMASESRVDKQDPQSAFRERVRHIKFLGEEVRDGQAVVKMQLLWEADLGKLPVLDELRELRVVPLGRGEYFLDCRFAVVATYGDITFASDATHYAWPYVRMHPQFSVEKGGATITSSAGGINQAGTLMKPARWLDYSGQVDGRAEGLAVFTADAAAPPPRWFTRDYGTFGPRRPDQQSGQPFVLKQGESLQQRVGILVHSGDVKAGQVAERYQRYVTGGL